MPTAILIFKISMPVEYHQRTLTFEKTHKLCHTETGRNTYEHVDMVRACFSFYDFNLFLLTQFSKYYSYVCFYLAIYLFAAIFRCKNYVILASPLRM